MSGNLAQLSNRWKKVQKKKSVRDPCPIVSVVETETSLQYERALEDGSVRRTRRQTITSPGRPITREQPHGSLKAAFSWTGCQSVPSFGSMENVRPSSLSLLNS